MLKQKIEKLNEKNIFRRIAYKLYGIYYDSILKFIMSAKKYHKKVSLKDYDKYCRSREITGCSTYEYFIYGFDQMDMETISTYLTEKRKYELISAIGDSMSAVTMFGSKKLFNKRFPEYLGREWLDLNETTFEEFCSFMDKHHKVIVKPDDLLQGKGIFIYDAINAEKSYAELYEFCKSGNYLVEEVIKQHPEMEQLNEGSVNTVRISTLFINDSVHIVSTALRIGGGNSCTDNFNNNGFGCALDAKTGAVISNGYNKSLKILPVHPVSGVAFKNIVVPMWEQVISLVTDTAKRAASFPQCKWLAWDIAISDGPIIIEGNWAQGADIIQIGQSGIYNKIKQLISQEFKVD